ncbi:MAG: type I glyceraldehyde-3-phosphate dehydrogenase [Gammaproteobacteria bacterium]|nr:type I glyceraldehyde-3-phosphate dehydrogenase [Gammaproteobacteria bacterium]MBQ15293.1 type I glyceraldehyde-3-phosphate dehydrogenase [Gammaproteobacteria bacterium]MDP6096739.1 type I glyceraldehyde-3-phosphate dehydrogenase [Gammaproteobacteria bacterium]MDP7455489.1 type I glyceraldehyde-3-phosphate dehydrogenase [Gammaproteobacteria bacterium]HJO10964.1 type I glyceraldehyde-3-phosphate dehydrogenase [Gammaproteobacteria bacterium]
MSLPKIAINGFGRIGRTIMRIAKTHAYYDVVAVNDLASPEQLAYAFKYDSIHGTFPGEISLSGDTMEINGDPFEVLGERDPAKLPWREMEVDYVIESSGAFRHLVDLNKHLDAGAKRLILTVPCKDPLEATLVTGVNDHVVTESSSIISNASCTTNCAAPLAKVLHESFGIKRGLLTTVHAYTSDQRLIDAPHKDKRRSRNAATNIVPTSTGAARAIGLVLPELAGKLDGIAMRVPVPDGSLIDLTVEVEKDVTVAEVNAAMAAAAAGPLKNILAYTEEALVSSDIIGNSHSSIFDSLLTQVMDKRLVKVVSWYDNEWGYSTRIEELITRLATMDGLSVSN